MISDERDAPLPLRRSRVSLRLHSSRGLLTSAWKVSCFPLFTSSRRVNTVHLHYFNLEGPAFPSALFTFFLAIIRVNTIQYYTSTASAWKVPLFPLFTFFLATRSLNLSPPTSILLNPSMDCTGTRCIRSYSQANATAGCFTMLGFYGYCLFAPMLT